MPRKKKKPGVGDGPLPTIWRVPDPVWERVAVLLASHDPPKRTGPGRSPERASLDGLIHVGQTGCQWNESPEEFGDDSSVQRAMTRRVKCDPLEHLWPLRLSGCDELNDVEWTWPSADGAMGKARHGEDDVGPNPTERGTERHEAEPAGRGRQRPLSIVLAGANVHDCKLLERTIGAVVAGRPGPGEGPEQHLRMDRGYGNPACRAAAEGGGHVPHVRRIGEEKEDYRRREGRPRARR